MMTVVQEVAATHAGGKVLATLLEQFTGTEGTAAAGATAGAAVEAPGKAKGSKGTTNDKKGMEKATDEKKGGGKDKTAEQKKVASKKRKQG